MRWRGTEGMGFGDVKLMAMVGAFLGMKLTVFTDFYRVAGGIDLWIEHGFCGVAEAHAPLYEAAGQRASGAAARMAVGASRLPQLSDAVWRFSGKHGAVCILFRQPVSALVRRALVRILANPVVLRAIVVLFCATFAFLMGLFCIRGLRKSIAEESDFSAEPTPSLETLPLHLYNTVIQQLKQQKHELQVQSKAEQHRARISENFSQAVLSNLSCGVLVFGTNGLVKTANPAAKAILGFASTTGMGAEDIFRGAVVSSGEVASVRAGG